MRGRSLTLLPPHQPGHRAPFGSINTAFAGTILVVLPYAATTQSLSWLVRGLDDSAGAGLPPMLPEQSTSPGCLATGSVSPLLQQPPLGPGDHPGSPLGTALAGGVEHPVLEHPLPVRAAGASLCLAQGAQLPLAPSRDSVLGTGQQRWLKCRRAGRPGAAEITNTCLF